MKPLLLLITMFLLAGCNTTPKLTLPPARPADRPSTPVAIQALAESAREAHVTLVGPDEKSGLRQVVIDMTPDNLPTSKAIAIERIEQVDIAVKEIIVAAPVAKKSAMDDAKAIADLQAAVVKLQGEIKKLNANDPVVFWGNLTGGLCILGGLVCLGIGVWANIAGLRTLAILPIGIGFATLTLIRFLHAIENVILGGLAAAVVFGVVWLILHRKVIRDRLADLDPLTAPAPPFTASTATGPVRGGFAAGGHLP